MRSGSFAPLALFCLGLVAEALLLRTAFASQSIPSFSPNPCLAEQPCTAHRHVFASDLEGIHTYGERGSRWTHDAWSNRCLPARKGRQSSAVLHIDADRINEVSAIMRYSRNSIHTLETFFWYSLGYSIAKFENVSRL